MAREIHLHYPIQTVPISITGKTCALSCAHCGGHYLASMKDASLLASINSLPERTKSVLVSGGCDSKGAVPLVEHVDLIRNLKTAGLRLNVHTGLLSPQDAAIIAPLADVISFDFITDQPTIDEVYGHGRTGEDYEGAYRILLEKAAVVPHLTIGLLGGQIRGETDALRRLAELGCERLVFLVFIPTKGTKYQDRKPPSIEAVKKIFIYAAEWLPQVEFSLGCMHPRGKYKASLEQVAYECGINSYVNPTREFRRFLENEPVIISTSKECCALDSPVGGDCKGPRVQ